MRRISFLLCSCALAGRAWGRGETFFSSLWRQVALEVWGDEDFVMRAKQETPDSISSVVLALMVSGGS